MSLLIIVMVYELKNSYLKENIFKEVGLINMILIIDFGSQVTQLIARRLRDAGFYSEIVLSTSDCNEYIEKKPKGIILSGGPNSVTEFDTPRAPDLRCIRQRMGWFGRLRHWRSRGDDLPPAQRQPNWWSPDRFRRSAPYP